MTRDENEIIIEAWNTVLFDKFLRFKHLLVDGLSSHSDEALARHGQPEASNVLDIGCGFGDSTLRIARSVGPSGKAVGVDCARRFVDHAAEAAREACVDNVRFLVADAQTGDLGTAYDFAFARFGTMFFSLPGAAMRNVRRSLRPGGSFTQVVWRKREDNPWLHDAELCVRGLVPVVEHDQTDQVHCGPGPFSMAGPDMVSGMLQAAGFSHVTFERFDADICIGHSLGEAVEFAMALGPAGEIIRLAGAEGERRKPQVIEALRGVLAKYARDDGLIWAPSSTWFITARNPG